MDDSDDVTKLKELDDLDERLFGEIKKKPLEKSDSKENKTPELTDDVHLDSDSFDDSDVADLLNDDDIFSKQVKSPIKQSSSVVLSPKNSSDSLKQTTPTLANKSTVEATPPKKTVNQANLDFSDNEDILTSFKSGLSDSKLKEPKTSSPIKTDTLKRNSLIGNEISSNPVDLKDSEKRKPSISGSGGDVDDEDNNSDELDDNDDDIFKTLGLDDDDDKKNFQKSSSVLGDLLGRQTSDDRDKKQTVNVKEDKLKTTASKDMDEDDDVFSSYIPTAQKKSDTASGNIQRRRGSLYKQVSFKDLDDSPIKLSKTSDQTTKDSDLSLKDNNPSKKPAAEKSSIQKDDEMDWATFFKEDPKKPDKSSPKKNESKVPKDNVASTNTRRRSSSADWLGLSEKSSEKDDPMSWLKSNDAPKPATADPAVARSRRQPLARHDTNALDWLGASSKETVNKMDVEKIPDLPAEALKLPRKKSIADPNLGHSLSLQEKNDVDYIPPISKSNEAYFRLPTEMADQSIAQVSNASFHTASGFSSPRSPSAIPLQHSHSDAFNSLQTMLNNSITERDQLAKSLETMRLTYEEKIKSIEAFHMNQIKSHEGSLQATEKSLRKEYEAKLQALEDQLKLIENSGKKSELSLKSKFEDIEKEHKKEIHRLKELHTQSIEVMKQDHEDSLNRLKRLKDQEVEAITSTQSHTRSLQHLSDELETRAVEMAALQSKMEERNQTVMKEKQVLLDAKEKDLKALQERLQRQLEEGDSERTRLQQLVLRLENRLQKHTMEEEEDRWEVQQMKARLTVQQKFMNEEHQQHLQQLEREKEKLRLSQDSLLHEQKTVLLQLAQERQQLTQEKMDLESLAKKIKEEEARWNVRKMKEENTFEAQRRNLQQQEDKLHWESMRVEQESQQLERESESIQKEKQRLKQEQEKIGELRMSVQRREDDAAQMNASAASEKEQCHKALAEARKIENDHRSRMEQFTQFMQALMNKEHQILLEKEKLVEERAELEKKKDSLLCHRCKLAVGLPVNALPPPINTTTALPQVNMNNLSHQIQQHVTASSLTRTASFQEVNGISSHLQQRMDPSLVVWYITAQKDREFLQEELSFLHSLKDSKPS